MRIAVQGLWHLGCVTAGCLAEAGFQVVGLDPEPRVVEDLRAGRPPLHEPGLAELIAAGQASGRLSFTTDPAEALAGSTLWWITFDTPVDEHDVADVAFVRRQVATAAAHAEPGTVVLVSSQVPVGFTGGLEQAWADQRLGWAVSPENLRLGQALACFRHPHRVVIGLRGTYGREILEQVFAPFCSRLEWMSVESAEMTKHALNAFLATSVTFINELARLCEVVGADAQEVERGLKSEPRIGPGAYLSPGPAFAGGTLARDVAFLSGIGRSHRVETPLLAGVQASNEAHKNWMKEQVDRLLAAGAQPVAAVLGLTYKPGTDTLRRSAAVDLCRHLLDRGVTVRVHDPLVRRLPEDLHQRVVWCSSPAEALTGADVAVLATPWPEYRQLDSDLLVARMRRPQVVDAFHFLAAQVGTDSRVAYVVTGRVRAAA